ncbi:DUF72 domain-containing protein [Verrucomicrobia bacterium LW23]|nr:DUF72 domain-containing protein [Verrucomicrobia bacterium LW23]
MLGGLFREFPLHRFSTRLRELAANGIYLGTSSWKYPGWVGMLYEEQRYLVRNRFSLKRFEEQCLSEYGETLSTVGVDSTYYAFPTTESLVKLSDQVPDGFKFGFKVTDTISLRRFPRIKRYDFTAGLENPGFLNADLFVERFLGPCEQIRDKVGPLMFEFSSFEEQGVEREEFLEKLEAFFAKLPPGWLYCTEIRDSPLLGEAYFSMLARYGVGHVFNSWTAMPPVLAQLDLPGSVAGNCVAARFLLRPGKTYAKAVERYEPFDRTHDIYPDGRKAIRHMIDMTVPANGCKRVPKFLFINNRLEGNALNTILATIQGENTT